LELQLQPPREDEGASAVASPSPQQHGQPLPTGCTCWQALHKVRSLKDEHREAMLQHARTDLHTHESGARRPAPLNVAKVAQAAARRADEGAPEKLGMPLNRKASVTQARARSELREGGGVLTPLAPSQVTAAEREAAIARAAAAAEKARKEAAKAKPIVLLAKDKSKSPPKRNPKCAS